MVQLPCEASSPGQLGEREKRRNRLGYHRTSVACAHCRHRKIRCLAEPGESNCRPCGRLQRPCVFEPVQQATRPKRARSMPQDGNTTKVKKSPPPPTASIRAAVPEVVPEAVSETVQEVAVPVSYPDYNTHRDQHDNRRHHSDQATPDGLSMYSPSSNMLPEPASHAAIAANPVVWPTGPGYLDGPVMSTSAPGVSRYTPMQEQFQHQNQHHYHTYQVYTPHSLHEQPSYTIHHSPPWQEWAYPPPPL